MSSGSSESATSSIYLALPSPYRRPLKASDTNSEAAALEANQFVAQQQQQQKRQQQQQQAKGRRGDICQGKWEHATPPMALAWAPMAAAAMELYVTLAGYSGNCERL